MEYIAKEAGIGKGTIYEYFSGKERLFQEMLKYSMKEFCAGLKAAADQEKSIAEKLLNCSKYYASFLMEHMDIIQISTQVNLLSKELRVQFLEGQEAIHAYYRAIVKAAKEKLELRPDLDDELATFCIMGTLDKFCSQRVLLNRRPLEEIDYQSIVDVILQGLK